MGDRRLLEAAFVNLAINSLQAIGAEGGRIEFCVASTPAGLEVCVRDTGPGFARRGLPELADPALRQLAGCGGTGLGLSIVRAAVYIHGGRLHIGDIEPRGAEVGIVLPVFG
ncbi:MAG: ATP-binding protein [Limnochordaceae bacterium]|nr:ATP-binding protein [Limnochordaceae bacterium]